MTTARVTQSTIRVVTDGTAKARVTQSTIRVVSTAINHARVSQATIRVVSSNTADPSGAIARPVVFVAT